MPRALVGLLAALMLASTLLFSAMPAAADPDTYVVEPGDTLASIAQRFGTTVDELSQINRLGDVDYVVVGQQLLVRRAERLHRVAYGERLVDIADTYGVSAGELVVRNRLSNPDFLYPGQELVIPPPSATSARAPARRRVWVPYRSQFDGSAYEQANCGPATLAMVMSFYGEVWTTISIRRSVAESSGNPSYDVGSTWFDLGYAARQRGFTVGGLFDTSGVYHRWSIEELMQQIAQGRPTVLLVRFLSLPGHAGKDWEGDHYIIFLGLTPAGDVVYHDSAFRGDEGEYRVMSREQLDRAWGRTAVGINYSALYLTWE